MGKTVFGCLGVAAVAFALQFTPANVQAAGLFSRLSNCTPCSEVDCHPCDDADVCDPCDAVCGTKAGKYFLKGHAEAGFFANGHGRKNNYAVPADDDGRPGNSIYLVNAENTGAQINQIYISMGKAVDGKRKLDIGGTLDFTWGTDANYVQSAGLETETGHFGDWGSGDYNAAIAQAYIELAYRKWNVKIGKFATPFASNPYASTDNFFYSWGTTAYIAPFVAGGAYATYEVNDKLAVFGGWVMPNEIGESSKNNAFLGGFDWSLGKRVNLIYAVAIGENTYAGNPYATYGITAYDYSVHSFVATTQINKKLKYIFDWTYLDATVDGMGNLAIYGINNEIIYQYNKKWAFGARLGMLHAGSFGASPVDNFKNKDAEWYTVSLGANWTPRKWLTVKPEVRYDWTDKGGKPTLFNDFTSNYQVSGGMSAVVKF